jgi:hypothetical protein
MKRKSINDCQSLAETKAWIREADKIAAAIPRQRPWLLDIQIIETRQYLKKLFDKKIARVTIKPLAAEE